MEESDCRKMYCKMYRAMIPHRCLFEKAVLSRHCACSQARRLALAEREAIACDSSVGRTQCEAWLGLLRERALFALHTRGGVGPLPHAKEIKLQAGGLKGVAALVDAPAAQPWLTEGRVSDVFALLDAARIQYSGLQNVPFEEVVRAVVHFQGRPKRPSRRR